MNELEQRVARALHEQAAAEVPAVDLWPAIRARLAPAQPQPRRRTRLALPATRSGRLSFALALVIALSGAAWAVPRLGEVLFHRDDGLGYAELAGLTHMIEQRQTIGGLTVTLHRAYADQHRIAVGLTAESADGESYYIRSAALDGQDGTSFQQTSSWADSIDSWSVLPVSFQARENEQGNVWNFGVTEDLGTPIALGLHLTVETARWPNDEQAASGETFTFDSSVPFNPAQTIEIGQTQRAAGVTMTLKQVNVTPSALQTTVCFESPTPGQRWSPEYDLFVGGKRATSHGGVYRSRPTDEDADCDTHIFYQSVASASGWTLRVNELHLHDEYIAGLLRSDAEEIDGPWEFHYPAPQPAPLFERGDPIRPQAQARGRSSSDVLAVGLNWLNVTIEHVEDGLMYQVVCREAKDYNAYRVEIFRQTVAVSDAGRDGPRQHCVAGEVLAAGGPLVPPGPLPYEFGIKLSVKDDQLGGGFSSASRYIWESDGQIYREK